MKKILTFQGKKRVYDTDTAKVIGYIEPAGYDRNNFSYWRETLQITKSGAYFIHGEGHGNSPYGEWHGNTGGWGENIKPITLAEAQEWAAENLSGEKYLESFGPPEDEDGTVDLRLSVSPGFRHKMEIMRSETGKSIGQLIEEKFAE